MKSQMLNNIKIQKKEIFSKILIGSILGIIAIIQLYPLVWLLLFSLKDNAEIFGENVMGLPRKFLWENYNDAFSSGKVGLFFLNSVIVTGASIIVSNILACMAAYGIIRMKWKLSKATLTIFLMGLMIPLQAALLPVFIILTKTKLYDTLWALIIPYTAFALPMAIFLLSSYMQSIPRELEEAALIDGCNIYKIFYSIILPVVKPAIATISILTFLACWNELMFAVTFISTEKYRTLTVGLRFMAGQYTTQWGPIGAGLVIASLPTLVIYILLSSQVQKSITTGALKG
ncbi:MAG: carbohydrate ABC transporter permease [Clostridiales bacterium]